MNDDQELLRAKARLMWLLLRMGEAKWTEIERMVYQGLRHDTQIQQAYAERKKAG